MGSCFHGAGVCPNASPKTVFSNFFFSILIIFLGGCRGSHLENKPDDGNRLLAITHVSVIDATGSPAQPEMTVVIDRGRIKTVGKSVEVRLPANTQVVEGTGKFLTPGLVDMHVHTAWDPYFVGPLMLANGITGVREMFAYDISAIRRERRDAEEGKAQGPRILAAGQIVDGPESPWPGAMKVRNPREAREAVDAIKRNGFDFVKVYSSLDREEYFAIAEESKRVGIPFAGHVPGVIRDSEASTAGQKSIEHGLGILQECSSREEQPRNPAAGAKDKAISHFAEQQMEMDTYSDEKATALFALFRKNQTWQVPTLVVMRNAALYGDSGYVRELSKSPPLRYVPYALRMMWTLGLWFPPKLTSEELATSRRYFQWQMRTVGEMQKAGVGILAGTDAPNPYVYPGFGLQDELGLLVQAGLTPMQAIQSATRNPAEFLGKLDSMGTIEVGKIADLDLLDANPLEDIQNMQRLNAVILGGRLIPNSELESLLARAEGNRWRANPAAITLMGLLLHMLRKLIYTVLAVLAVILVGSSLLVKKRREARTANP